MSKAAFSAKARDDLREIVRHIARDKPDAARKWRVRMRKTCEMLANNPGLGELRPGYGPPGCRSFSVGSYVIFFAPTDEGIDVARIIPGSRDLKNL